MSVSPSSSLTGPSGPGTVPSPGHAGADDHADPGPDQPPAGTRGTQPPPATTGPAPAAGASRATPAPAVPRRRWVHRPGRADLLAVLVSLAGAGWLTSGLWIAPGHRALRVNASDQALFEWLLSYGAHALTHRHDPLWTTLLNTPHGVNLAVNTSVTVLAVVLAPVTLTLGAPVAFTLALTANLALSTFAWYLLLSRRLPVGPGPALLGAVCCGFAPGVVSHANGHLNFTAQFLVPLIVAIVLGLPRSAHPVRRGALLGLLIAVQYSLGAEVLFFTALACAVFLLAWVAAGGRRPPAELRRLATGLGVTAVVGAVLLGYPLWLQFLGPQTYHGTGFSQRVHSEDLLAYGAYPRRSLAGVAGLHTGLAPNPTEENSFFGLGLLLLAVPGTMLLLRRYRTDPDPARRLLVRALAGTAVVFAVLALGPRLKVHRDITAVPLPFALLSRLPLFDSALPARLALVLAPILGVLVALAAAELPRLTGGSAGTRGQPARSWWAPRRLAAAALVAALVPVTPVPLLAMDRSPVPRFFTSGDWQRYAGPGETVVPVPPPSDLTPDGQRWQADALARGGPVFRIPAGFFLGPGGPDGRGRIGPIPRPTYALLSQVALTGDEPYLTDRDQTQARADLRYWRARVVVLPDGGTGNRWHAHHDALLRVTSYLLGPGQRVGDVWLWVV